MTRELVKRNSRRIKDLLPDGAINQLAQEFDLQRQSVSRILAGAWRNERVVRRAMELIERRSAEAKDLLRDLRQES